MYVFVCVRLPVGVRVVSFSFWRIVLRCFKVVLVGCVGRTCMPKCGVYITCYVQALLTCMIRRLIYILFLFTFIFLLILQLVSEKTEGLYK